MTEFPKTTEGLIALLDQKRLTCCQDQSGKFNLHPDLPVTVNPQFHPDLLVNFLGINGMAQIVAYWEFRDLVRVYQVSNNISALRVKGMRLGDRILSFHQPCDQLNVLPSDLEVLKLEKPQMVAAWADWVRQQNLLVYSTLPDNDTVFHDLDDVCRFVDQCDWADFYTHDELTLRLGWGDPNAALFDRDDQSDDAHFYVVDQATVRQGWAQGDPVIWMNVVQRRSCPIRPMAPEV